MNHIKQLDGLRCIAVLLVLLEHFAMFIGRPISAGFYGVDLFFVMSGFLITNILLRSKENFGLAYKNFIGRRTLRIFPIYYLTILVLYAVGNKYVHEYLLYCVTYTYNYAMLYFSIPTSSINHFWSLCVEEQFYLFWPFLVLALRGRLTWLKWTILAIIIFCFLQLYFTVIPAWGKYSYVGLVPRASSLGIGALGAVFYLEGSIPVQWLKSRWVENACFAALIYFLVADNHLKFIAWPILSLFFVLKTTQEGFSFRLLNNFLNHKKVVYLGTIAYGIYLYHLPIGDYFTEQLLDPYVWNKIPWNSLGVFKILRWHAWIVKFPLYTLVTILVAHCSYKYFETPILSLKDKWFRYQREPNQSDSNKLAPTLPGSNADASV